MAMYWRAAASCWTGRAAICSTTSGCNGRIWDSPLTAYAHLLRVTVGWRDTAALRRRHLAVIDALFVRRLAGQPFLGSLDTARGRRVALVRGQRRAAHRASEKT